MPFNHLILCLPLLLSPSIFHSIKVFSNESALCIRWPKYWSFSFNISPSNEYPGLISSRMDWLDLLVVQGTLKSLLQHHSSKASIFRCSAFFFIYIYFIIFLTLQYCIGFAIYQHEPTTGIHVFPILNPPHFSLLVPSHGSSQCTSPKHPVSCIEPGLATHFIYDIIHVSMPFSQIIPLSPSPTESKRLFYTSVSLLLSCIQGYCYDLSKFHIYALVYYIGVFLSSLLHSVI